MPDKNDLNDLKARDDLKSRIDLLLRENAAVREASDELVKEAARLRAKIEKCEADERRKKPRLRGK
jgi:hypothetical protein